MHINTYVYTYIYIYVYTCVYIYMYILIHIMSMYMHGYTNTHMVMYVTQARVVTRMLRDDTLPHCTALFVQTFVYMRGHKLYVVSCVSIGNNSVACTCTRTKRYT